MIVSVLVVLFLCYVTSDALPEGQICRVPGTKRNGRCIRLEKCEYARELLRQNLNPQTCGFAGFTSLVCCPIPQEVGTLSRKMCLEYTTEPDNNPAVNLGEDPEFPHMAAIGYSDIDSNLWLCGGTIISHYFVLSAAHCVNSAEYGPAKRIRLGDIHLKDTYPVVATIAQTYVHPHYKTSSHYHDIALFRLASRINFGINITPACLQTRKHLPVNMLEATGWGKPGPLGDTSLMKVTLSVVDHDRCARKYGSSRKLQHGILDQYEICAGDSRGKDACPGDLRWPLYYEVDEVNRVPRHFVVAGITSIDKGCGGENSVGVYTRVSSYVGWIENIVWQGKYQ